LLSLLHILALAGEYMLIQRLTKNGENSPSSSIDVKLFFLVKRISEIKSKIVI
jgi:hypothetical protein